MDMMVPAAARGATPILAYSPHPLLPSRGRELVHAEFYPGETLGAYLERVEIWRRIKNRPVMVAINGVAVPRAWWWRVRPKAGTLIQVQAVVGKGSGGKNPIATVLTIALLVAVPELVPGTGWQVGLTRVGILIAGSLAINALFPPPSTATDTGAAVQQDSPTYSLSGGSNRMRPYEPLPVIMGTHRVFPDLGAKPYTEFEGDNQVLYHIFDFGYNDISLSQFRIGGTPIENFDGVTLQESGTDGALTLFPANVDTAAGGALTEAAGWVTRTSSIDATALAVEVSGFLYYAGDAGIANRSVTIAVEYRELGSGTWLPFVDAGSEIVIESASRKPLRLTWWRQVAQGQYECRAQRVTPDETDARATSDIVWSQLRSYQPDSADYAGHKRVALKIRASGQLQGTIDQFSALAQASTELWNGSAWVTGATSNPAWWVLAAARGKFAGGRRKWGGGLPDARIGLENLKAFGAWCDAEGLTFNGVFDQQLSVAGMIDAIALQGRATLSNGSGQLEAIWDAPDLPAVAVFGMSNILRDSFEISYLTQNLADELVVSFRNRDLDYQPDVVRVLAPGVTTPVRSQNIELFGCDNLDEAARSGNLYIAGNIYRTRRLKWRMDWEAMPLSRGEVGMLSHDLASYDYSGRLIEGCTDSVLKIDRKVPLDAGGSFVTLVKPDASFATYAVTGGIGDSSTLTLNAPLAFDPGADPDHPPYDYRWLYGNTATPGKKVKIEAIRPVAYNMVEISALDEVPEYYAAEDGEFLYVTPPQFTAEFPVLSNLQITEELLLAGAVFVVKLTLTWDAAGLYDHANIRIGLRDSPYEVIGEARGRRFETIVNEEGQANVEITGIHPLFGAGPQSKISALYTILGKSAPPSDVTGFAGSFDGPATVLAWNSIPDVDVSEYDVRRGSTWSAAVSVGRTRANFLRIEALAAATDFLVKAVDTTGHESVSAASLTVTPLGAGQIAPLAAFDGGDLKLTWSVPGGGSYPVARYEVRHGATWAGGASLGFVDVTTFRALANWSGSRTWWVTAIDVAGVYGTPGSVEVVVTVPSAPSITPEVIDNNVLLRWTDATQTLPLKHYEVRRGVTFGGATVVGTVQARFSVLFESSAGTFSYWVVGVDSAGNYGIEQSVTVSVSQPPDFILYDQLQSDFSGTKTNCFIMPETGKLLAAIETAETFQQHFDNHSWTTPQDQIDAGFPIFIEPSQTTGSYEESTDLGTIVPSTLISVSMGSTELAGSVTVTPTISHKKFSGDSWTDHAGVWQAFATDFQFVKVKLDFASSGGDDLLLIDSLLTRLDVKIKRDSETITADSGDAGGTTVTFSVAFIDVRSINVTPQGTTPALSVVDFTDTPYPTEFKVLVFDLAGNRITRDVRWEASGV